MSSKSGALMAPGLMQVVGARQKQDRDSHAPEAELFLGLRCLSKVGLKQGMTIFPSPVFGL